MKHASTRETFRYWDECRGLRRVPERDEIDPGMIRKALGDSFLLAVDAERGHPFRLAGTRVCALFGRELKGEPFLQLWDASSRPLLSDLVDILTDEAVGLVAGASGRVGCEPMLPLELLLLPLAHRGSLRKRLLGVLAPLARPYWLGQQRLGPMTLGAFRHLEPTTAMPSFAPAVAGSRRVAGFVVHQGGVAARRARTVETTHES
jgi:hypothetical protein